MYHVLYAGAPHTNSHVYLKVGVVYLQYIPGSSRMSVVKLGVKLVKYTGERSVFARCMFNKPRLIATYISSLKKT